MSIIIRIPEWLLTLNFLDICYNYRFCISNIGSAGEKFARRWLQRNNFYILDQNWKIPDGELDLLAVYGRTLHVIEVKTRNADLPEQFSASYAIDQHKAEKLRYLVTSYMYRNKNLLKKIKIKETQIDLIAINYSAYGPLVYFDLDFIEQHVAMDS